MHYHPTVYTILTLLKTNNFWHETFEHAPVRTSDEAAKIRTGYTIAATRSTRLTCLVAESYICID